MNKTEISILQMIEQIESQIESMTKRIGDERINIVKKYCELAKLLLSRKGKYYQDNEKTIENIGVFTVREIETTETANLEFAKLIYRTSYYFERKYRNTAR